MATAPTPGKEVQPYVPPPLGVDVVPIVTYIAFAGLLYLVYKAVTKNK